MRYRANAVKVQVDIHTNAGAWPDESFAAVGFLVTAEDVEEIRNTNATTLTLRESPDTLPNEAAQRMGAQHDEVHDELLLRLRRAPSGREHPLQDPCSDIAGPLHFE
eukprot:TRINITY_DN23834_c1_g1_i4.p3 TRINITY_DN23834_c1_g1~~TRINITY_DN23834_c1_g1_i4.p3  ORF type:complete len:107 (-),score=14.30 TRINITY_DN23834_c1_g1_i4:62-382(-)